MAGRTTQAPAIMALMAQSDVDDRDEDCPFCMGREAAHQGKGPDFNPFPKTVHKGSTDWYESDHGLWVTGYGVGLHERRVSSRFVHDHHFAGLNISFALQ